MTDAEIIDAVLRYEGGFVNNPSDHGGPTNFGITAADYGRWKSLGRVADVDEVKKMTVQEARDIYTSWYIAAPGFTQIADDGLRWILVDSGVLHGTRTALKWLQQVLGVTVDGVIGSQTTGALASADAGKVSRGVLAVRISRYVSIVTKDNSQMQFLAGWINRATSLLRSV